MVNNELNKKNPQEVPHQSNAKFYFKCLDHPEHHPELKRLDNIVHQPNSILCKQCLSFGQYLIDNKIFNLWDKNNKELLVPLNGMVISTMNEIFNKMSIGNTLPKIFYDKYCNPIPDIKVYELNGDESDFSEYDKILKEEKDYILFYKCPKEKEQFIIDNLNFFINSRNAAIKGYNLNISEEKINRLKEQREEYIGENIYS